MPTSRRNILQSIKVNATTHPGLWLDKFLPNQDADGTKGQHIHDLGQIQVPEGYAAAFERRLAALKASPRPATHTLLEADAKATGRLVVGLGQKSVLEVGLTLDHTWGLPYLPGSSLKGIAALAARQSLDPAWHEPPQAQDEEDPKIGQSYLALFGDTEEVGAVHFLDAWWVPGNALPIHLDTMTVHHPEYYQRTDDTPPSDMDSPNPIAFASVTGTFRVLLEGPTAWAEKAFELLKRGLADHGIGAKTAGGYGRIDLERLSPATPKAETEPPVPSLPPAPTSMSTALANQIKNLSASNADTNAAKLLDQLEGQPFEEAGKKLMREKLKRAIKANPDKPWATRLSE